MGKRLSIIVPAYNEEQRIGRFLDAYLPFFAERYGDDVELLVVINGTTDDTERIVKSYQDRYPHLQVRVDPNPIGKGGAVILGMQEARGDFIGYVDADGSTPPLAFDALVEKAADVPAVIASRWCKGAEVSPRQPFVRRLASRVFNLMTRLLFGLKLTDTQCGAKVFRRDVIEAVHEKIGITRWAFDVDLLFQIKRAGYVIKEIPTVWHDVEGSKITVTESSLEMLAALVRLRLIYSPFGWVVRLYDRFLGGKGRSDHLLRHSVLIGMGSQVANGANLLFQIVMAHMLVGEDAVEYGVLSSMLGSIIMLNILFGSLGRRVTHFVALACKENRRATILPMMKYVSRDVLMISVVPLLLGLVMAPRLAKGFHLQSSFPLVLMVISVGIQFLNPIFSGVLNGLQAFRSVALLGICGSVLRLVASVMLVWLGFGAVGALGGNLISIMLVVAFSYLLAKRVLFAEGGSFLPYAHTFRFYHQVGGFALAAAGYALLTSSDVVLVKRFFAPEIAGDYALAAMVARIVFFLPMPIAVAMFPKVVSSQGRTTEARQTFHKALLFSSVVFLLPALVIELFPKFFIELLTAGNPETLAPMVRLLVLVYLPLPVCTLVLNYEQAQGRIWQAAWPMLLSGIVYVMVAKFIGGGVERVAYSLGISAYVCICWFFISSLLIRRHVPHEGVASV
jgi:dolichol-phosphate mannosyltransferase